MIHCWLDTVIMRCHVQLFYPASLSLLTTSRKNYRSNLHKNSTRDVSIDKEKLIKFIRVGIRIQELFEGFYSIAMYDIFSHNLAHISRKTDRSFMQILSRKSH